MYSKIRLIASVLLINYIFYTDLFATTNVSISDQKFLFKDTLRASVLDHNEMQETKGKFLPIIIALIRFPTPLQAPTNNCNNCH